MNKELLEQIGELERKAALQAIDPHALCAILRDIVEHLPSNPSDELAKLDIELAATEKRIEIERRKAAHLAITTFPKSRCGI